MRKIILYMVMTLDGYLARPNNQLDWFHLPEEQDLISDIVAILDSADTWIMAYPTAPGMIAYWTAVPNNPSAPPAERVIAPSLNKMRVVVMSNTRVTLDLDNAELVILKKDQDLIDLITELKNRPGKDIYVPGGVRTAQKFARLGLVDEYILMVHPVVIGSGKPLFTSRTDLELVRVKPYRSGVVQLRYRPQSTSK